MASVVSKLLAGNTKHALQAKWKRTIRKWPLARRAAWLNSEEGHIAFEARARWEKLNQIRSRIIELIRCVPSDTWLDMSQFYGDVFPPPGDSVRMVLSRGRIRIGTDDIPSRRFTPPQCVKVEDFLDEMDVLRARGYEHPPSITGIQITRIRRYKGREEREKLKVRKPVKKRNKKRIFISPPVELTYGEMGVQVVAPNRGKVVIG